MDRQQLAFELEGIMKTGDDYYSYKSLTDAPKKFLSCLKSNFKSKYPHSWGIHEKYGYFVVSSGGQGPSIDYLQNEQL